MLPETPLTHARAAIARACAAQKRHPEDPGAAARVAELRQAYRAALLEDRIRELVDAAPPLTDEQRHRLSALLHPSAVA